MLTSQYLEKGFLKHKHRQTHRLTQTRRERDIGIEAISGNIHISKAMKVIDHYWEWEVKEALKVVDHYVER